MVVAKLTRRPAITGAGRRIKHVSRNLSEWFCVPVPVGFVGLEHAPEAGFKPISMEVAQHEGWSKMAANF
jgi:hypothetical protein